MIAAARVRPARARDDRGSGLVAGLALIFAFTFLGLVWLARDVDRGISNRSAAHSIAFQAARAGAQSNDVFSLREGNRVLIEPDAARAAVAETATMLLTAYDLNGSVIGLDITADRVTVRIAVTDAGVRVTGQATVRAERTP